MIKSELRGVVEVETFSRLDECELLALASIAKLLRNEVSIDYPVERI